MEYKIKDIQTFGRVMDYFGSYSDRTQTMFLMENGDLYCCGSDWFSSSPFIHPDGMMYYPTKCAENIESIKCFNGWYGLDRIGGDIYRI